MYEKRMKPVQPWHLLLIIPGLVIVLIGLMAAFHP